MNNKKIKFVFKSEKNAYNFNDKDSSTSFFNLLNSLNLAENAYYENNLPDDLYVYEYTYRYSKKIIPDDFFGINGFLEMDVCPTNILNRIKNKTAILLIHTPHESYLEKHEIKNIHGYIKNHELPSSNVFYASCCLNAEDLYQQFCDENNLTPAFKNIYSSTFLKFSCDEAIRTINNRKIMAYVSSIKKKDFLIFNRRWHWHRVMFLYNIFKNNMSASFYMSFSKTHLDTNLSFTSVIREFFKNKNDEILEYDIVNTIENSLPLILDTEKFNEQSLMYEKFDNTKDFYINSMIHIISESKFQSEVIHCTEKTFKPIIHKQPFIVLGPAGMLKKIKELGFKSFENVWDESYDDIIDHEERLLKIVTLCKTISEWSPEKKLKAMHDCAAAINYNFYKLLQFKTKHEVVLSAIEQFNDVEYCV